MGVSRSLVSSSHRCAFPGPYGWGINHIITPDVSYDGEPLRQHFDGYLSDWVADHKS